MALTTQAYIPIETIRNTSPLSLKQLNDNFYYIANKIQGNIGEYDLDSAFVETLYAASATISNLFAAYGNIAELTVDQLNTSTKTTKYLNSDTSDVNYIKVYEQYIEFITASTDGTETEQLTNRGGDPLYWVDDTYTGTATDVTDYPVMVYVYTELTKAQISFESMSPSTNTECIFSLMDNKIGKADTATLTPIGQSSPISDHFSHLTISGDYIYASSFNDLRTTILYKYHINSLESVGSISSSDPFISGGTVYTYGDYLYIATAFKICKYDLETLNLQLTYTFENLANNYATVIADGNIYCSAYDGASKIFKLSADTLSVIASIPAANIVDSMVSDGTYLYASAREQSNLTWGAIYKYDLLTLTQQDYVEETQPIFKLAIGGDYLYASIGNGNEKIYKYDLETLTKQLESSASDASFEQLQASGDYLYASATIGSEYKTYKYDLETLTKQDELYNREFIAITQALGIPLYVPCITLGAGVGNTDHPDWGKGFIYKDEIGLCFKDIKEDGTVVAMRLGATTPETVTFTPESVTSESIIYELPTASDTTSGGIKVNNKTAIVDDSGFLSVGSNTIKKTASTSIGGQRIVALNSDDKVEYPTDYSKAIGLSMNAASEDDTVTIALGGIVADSSWSWISGSPLFLTANGLMTHTAPTSGMLLQVGHAISATQIFLNINQPIILN